MHVDDLARRAWQDKELKDSCIDSLRGGTLERFDISVAAVITHRRRDSFVRPFSRASQADGHHNGLAFA